MTNFEREQERTFARFCHTIGRAYACVKRAERIAARNRAEHYARQAELARALHK